MSAISYNENVYDSFHVLATQRSRNNYQTEIPQTCNEQSAIELLDDGYVNILQLYTNYLVIRYCTNKLLLKILSIRSV